MRNRIFTTLLLLAVAFVPAAAQKYERGVAQVGKNAPVVAAKGTWMFGGTVNGTGYTGNNYSFTAIQGINTNGYSAGIKPTIMYLVANNVGIGVKGSYKRGLFALDDAHLEVSDTKIEVKDIAQLKQTFGGAVFARYFIPLGNSGRFSIIGDLILGADGGNTRLTKRQDGLIIGTYQTNWTADLSVEFGMMAFFTKNFAMEAELGILGAGITGSKSAKNQVYQGSASSVKAYYSVNLLSLSVGAYLYF